MVKASDVWNSDKSTNVLNEIYLALFLILGILEVSIALTIYLVLHPVVRSYPNITNFLGGY